MIPKIIHYCWFGYGEKSSIIKKCLKSWEKKCPDYEIVEWNENNFNINRNRFCREAYLEKKWAFVSDYARLWILYNYGGIYFDTDIEVLKKMDPLLECKAFTGFESEKFLQTGVIACQKYDYMIGLMLEKYESKTLYDEFGNINMEPNVIEFTKLFKKHGLVINNQYQKIEKWSVYPSTYFTPIDPHGNRNKTKHSYTDHHFTSTWEIEENKNLVALRRSLSYRIKKKLYQVYKKIQQTIKS